MFLVIHKFLELSQCFYDISGHVSEHRNLSAPRFKTIEFTEDLDRNNYRSEEKETDNGKLELPPSSYQFKRNKKKSQLGGNQERKYP